MPDTSPPPLEYHIYDPERQEIRVVVIQPPKRRYWLHALLFLATIFTTLCIGARLQFNFDHDLPLISGAVSNGLDYWPWVWAVQDWHRLLLGIPFSACLLGILTAHEMGHFVFCVKRKVYATLPFFIPSITLIGTVGAFIRIRSPIRSRSDLFDIGIAGPIAGFLVAVPVLFFSLLHAKPLTQLSGPTDITFGMPLIFSLAHRLLAALGNPLSAQFGLHDLYLPPMGVAAWFGMFATALNLLPGGQLDGGHIIYAVKPQLHRTISLISVLILLPLAWYFWIGWLLWAVVLRMTGSRHPQVPPVPGLDRKRLLLAAFGVLMLVLTLTPSPLPGSSIPEVLKSYHEQTTQEPSK